MLLKKLLILTLPIVVLSCVTEKEHYYYLQNPQQISLFKEKSEVRLSGHGSFGREINAFGLQGAYSITDKFAVAANWMKFENASNTTINGVSTGYWSGQYFDGAFGYYKDFKKNGLVEVYAGYGWGEQTHSYSNITEEWQTILFIPVLSQTATPIGTALLNTNKLFIQPSYGYSFNGIDVAVSTRYTYLNFDYVSNKVNNNFEEYNEVNFFEKNRSFLLFEPAITFRGGWKYAKAQLQYAYTGFMDGNDFRMSHYTFSFGLQIAIAKRFWKKKPETLIEKNTEIK